MDEGMLQQILATLNPGRLREIVVQIAGTQAPDNRDGVTLGSIMEALTHKADLGAGQEGWEAYLKLKEAIRSLVEQIPGMKYVEADA
jgi:hypothetical protein